MKIKCSSCGVTRDESYFRLDDVCFGCDTELQEAARSLKPDCDPHNMMCELEMKALDDPNEANWKSFCTPCPYKILFEAIHGDE